MNNLPVSKKVYADISTRISSALSHDPASAHEALRLVDSYLAGAEPESHNACAMLAFNMIKVEIDRAVSRSARARERARLRHETRDSAKAESDTTSPLTDTAAEAEARRSTETAPKAEPPRLSRRERRARKRANGRFGKKKWGALQQ